MVSQPTLRFDVRRALARPSQLRAVVAIEQRKPRARVEAPSSARASTSPHPAGSRTILTSATSPSFLEGWNATALPTTCVSGHGHGSTLIRFGRFSIPSNAPRLNTSLTDPAAGAALASRPRTASTISSTIRFGNDTRPVVAGPDPRARPPARSCLSFQHPARLGRSVSSGRTVPPAGSPAPTAPGCPSASTIAFRIWAVWARSTAPAARTRPGSAPPVVPRGSSHSDRAAMTTAAIGRSPPRQ